MSWFNSRIYSKKAKLQINFSTCDLRYKDSKNRKIELYILIYIVYYLYIYNNTLSVSRGLFQVGVTGCHIASYLPLESVPLCVRQKGAFLSPKWRL